MAEPEPQEPRRSVDPSETRRPMRRGSIAIWIAFGILAIVLIIAFLQGARESEEPDTREPVEDFQIQDPPTDTSSSLSTEEYPESATPLLLDRAS